MESKQDREWRSKAVAEYQKITASLISLSSTALVLPTLFLKDFVGLKAGDSLRNAVSCSVIIAWCFFFITIFCCLIYYYASAKWLKQAYGGTLKVSESCVEHWLDFSFWVAGITFIMGLILLLNFMVTYVPKS